MGFTRKALVLFVVVALVAMTTNAAASSKPITYNIGETYGWSSKTGVMNYTEWASSSIPIHVGDTIRFFFHEDFGQGLDNVVQVTLADYISCTTRAPLDTFTTDNDSIQITEKYDHYYFIGIPGNCDMGLKLDFQVVGVTGVANQTPTTPPPHKSSPTKSSGSTPPPPHKPSPPKLTGTTSPPPYKSSPPKSVGSTPPPPRTSAPPKSSGSTPPPHKYSPPKSTGTTSPPPYKSSPPKSVGSTPPARTSAPPKSSGSTLPLQTPPSPPAPTSSPLPASPPKSSGSNFVSCSHLVLFVGVAAYLSFIH